MVELTPELIIELSKTRNGFYSWDYVAGLAAWILGVEAENGRLQARVQELEMFQDLVNKWSDQYYRDTNKLKQRIAELEQGQRWIHQDKTMIVKKDGDSWCFVLPDFVNLHESGAEFVDGILYRFIEEIYKRLLPPKEGE